MLQRAGWMMAAATWPIARRVAASPQAQPSAWAATPRSHPVSDITAKLSTYMSEAGGRPLPDKVLEQAKWHILDTIAAMISGSELPPGRAAIAFARAYAGNTLATIVGDTALGSPIEAALANGVLAHADETDDSWPSGWHPGCSTVPAALAVGEQFGISGARFVRAVALGYDVGSRMLIDKTVTFRSVHDLSRMQDPRVLALRAKVRLEEPASGGGGRGAGRLPLVEIALNDGTRLTQDTGPVLGTVENPMTRGQFVAKCRDLMTPVLGEAQSTRLIDRVLDLEHTSDVRELRPLLQRTYRPGAPRLSEYPKR